MKKILVVGSNGKMGKLIFQRLSNDYEAVGCDIDDKINDYADCDLVIDFSTAANSIKTAMFCAENKIPLIIGATGHDSDENKKIREYSKKVAILKSSNFSLGILLLKKIIQQFDGCELDKIYIIDKHHKDKIDSPSGTAIDLEKYILKVLNKSAETFSIRAGSEVGEHSINLYFGDEKITISHQAFSRNAFVDGVEMCVKFMIKNKKKKLFNFDEVLF